MSLYDFWLPYAVGVLSGASVMMILVSWDFRRRG